MRNVRMASCDCQKAALFLVLWHWSSATRVFSTGFDGGSVPQNCFVSNGELKEDGPGGNGYLDLELDGYIECELNVSTPVALNISAGVWSEGLTAFCSLQVSEACDGSFTTVLSTAAGSSSDAIGVFANVAPRPCAVAMRFSAVGDGVCSVDHWTVATADCSEGCLQCMGGGTKLLPTACLACDNARGYYDNNGASADGVCVAASAGCAIGFLDEDGDGTISSDTECIPRRCSTGCLDCAGPGTLLEPFACLKCDNARGYFDSNGGAAGGWCVAGQEGCASDFVDANLNGIVESDAECVPVLPCRAIAAPFHGSVGTCNTTIPSGASCDIACMDGHSRMGPSPNRCFHGKYEGVQTCTDAPCNAPSFLGYNLSLCAGSVDAGGSGKIDAPRCTPQCADGYEGVPRLIACAEANQPVQLSGCRFIYPIMCALDEWYNGGKCHPCPSGAVCFGDARALPKMGYFSPNVERRPTHCETEESCITPDWQNDMSAITAEGGITGQCNEERGYVGEYCSECMEKFFKESGRCLPCENKEGKLLLVASVVMWCVYVALLAYLVAHSSTGKLSRSDVIIVNLQQMVFVVRLMSVHLPSPATQVMLRWLALLLLDVEFFAPGCLSPYEDVLGMWWMNLLCVASLGVLIVVLIRVTTRRQVSSKSMYLRGFMFFVRVSMQILVYRSVSGVTCTPVDEGNGITGYRLRSDLRVECFEGKHIPSMIAMFGYVILLTVVCALSIFAVGKARKIQRHEEESDSERTNRTTHRSLRSGNTRSIVDLTRTRFRHDNRLPAFRGEVVAFEYLSSPLKSGCWWLFLVDIVLVVYVSIVVAVAYHGQIIGLWVASLYACKFTLLVALEPYKSPVLNMTLVSITAASFLLTLVFMFFFNAGTVTTVGAIVFGMWALVVVSARAFMSHWCMLTKGTAHDGAHDGAEADGSRATTRLPPVATFFEGHTHPAIAVWDVSQARDMQEKSASTSPGLPLGPLAQATTNSVATLAQSGRIPDDLFVDYYSYEEVEDSSDHEPTPRQTAQ